MIQIDVDSWDQFRTFVEQEPPEGVGFFWRGQRDPKWPLAASLERKVLAFRGGDQEGAPLVYPYGDRFTSTELCDLTRRYERTARLHLDAFRRAASGLRGGSPKELSEEQWWALGRHYGLATPLLDWTEKPYIALFFALKGVGTVGERDPPSRAQQFALYRLTVAPQLADETLKIVSTPIDELGRMQQQRGVFTWIRSDRHFELQGLLDDTGRGQLLTQLRISSRLMPRALRDLDLHGIDHRLLFPDMYGAAAFANSRLDLDALDPDGV